MTAGNASAIADGASALVVTSRKKAAELGAKPIAQLVSYATAAVEPAIMGLGETKAAQMALEKAGMTAQGRSARRAERGLRLRRRARHPRARSRSRHRQRQRRRGRSRPPARQHRHADDRHAHPRAQEARPGDRPHRRLRGRRPGRRLRDQGRRLSQEWRLAIERRPSPPRGGRRRRPTAAPGEGERP